MLLALLSAAAAGPIFGLDLDAHAPDPSGPRTSAEGQVYPDGWTEDGALIGDILRPADGREALSQGLTLELGARPRPWLRADVTLGWHRHPARYVVQRRTDQGWEDSQETLWVSDMRLTPGVQLAASAPIQRPGRPLLGYVQLGLGYPWWRGVTHLGPGDAWGGLFTKASLATLSDYEAGAGAPQLRGLIELELGASVQLRPALALELGLGVELDKIGAPAPLRVSSTNTPDYMRSSALEIQAAGPARLSVGPSLTLRFGEAAPALPPAPPADAAPQP